MGAKYTSGLIFRDYGDGTCILHRGRSVKDAEVIIPDIVLRGDCRGKAVSVIGSEAFFYNVDITSVVIPDSVQKIESLAFCDCFKLKRIHLGKNLKKIAKDAFRGCPIEDITVDPQNKKYKVLDGVLYTGKGETLIRCFSKNVDSLVIPESVKKIEDGAFFDSTIREIKMTNNVSHIGFDAFNSCNIESIEIPDKVTEIGEWAFNGCENLKNVVIGKGCLSILDSAFAHTAIENIIIPESVKHIGTNAFRDCSALCSVSLPDDLERLDGHAFAGCTNLKAITIPKNVTEIEYHTFWNCNNLELIQLSDEVSDIHDDAFENCSKLTIKAPKYSYAEEYAKKHNIKFEAI